MQKFSYPSMGTKWEITVWDDVDPVVLEDLKKSIIALSEDFDQTYSRFIKTSLVWKITEKAGRYEVPEDFTNMLKLYFELYEASDRKLNPLIGFTISDLGYDDVYSLIPREHIRVTPDLFETVKIFEESGETSGMEENKEGIGERKYYIETTVPVLFDFGALGKGYFVDKISDFLKSKNIQRFMVDGSGDIYYSGTEPIKAGLEHPTDPSMVIGNTNLSNQAMCASGINRRVWDKYHHVIDPHTGISTKKGIVATWVVAPTAALADALASCLFFVPPEAFARYSFQYVIMNEKNMIKKSEGWCGEMY